LITQNCEIEAQKKTNNPSLPLHYEEPESNEKGSKGTKGSKGNKGTREVCKGCQVCNAASKYKFDKKKSERCKLQRSNEISRS
jgi:hypothetical protein